jgi:hypothetical protein
VKRWNKGLGPRSKALNTLESFHLIGFFQVFVYTHSSFLLQKHRFAATIYLQSPFLSILLLHRLRHLHRHLAGQRLPWLYARIMVQRPLKLRRQIIALFIFLLLFFPLRPLLSIILLQFPLQLHLLFSLSLDFFALGFTQLFQIEGVIVELPKVVNVLKLISQLLFERTKLLL